MYRWLVFLHVVGVLGFMLAHGASANAAFMLRRERNLERVRALLNLSAGSIGVMFGFLLLLFVTGILSGFAGEWWGRLWIWLALALLVAISIAMFVLARRDYHPIRKAVGLEYMEGNKPHPPVETASAEEIDAVINRARPVLFTVIGFGGVIVIAWLMMFKPF